MELVPKDDCTQYMERSCDCCIMMYGVASMLCKGLELIKEWYNTDEVTYGGVMLCMTRPGGVVWGKAYQ